MGTFYMQIITIWLCLAQFTVALDDKVQSFLPHPFAVLDRIVDDTYAVLLVGKEEKEIVLPLTPACRPLLLHLIEHLVRPSDERRQSIEKRLRLLRQRSQSLPSPQPPQPPQPPDALDNEQPFIRPAFANDCPVDATNPF